MPSELRDAARREPLEALALALALGAPVRADPALGDRPARRAASRSSGDDLLAAGVPEGPALGRALEETLRRKLDGLVSGPRGRARAPRWSSPGSDAQSSCPARRAFSTRQGGVSEGPYESLNLGILTDDEPRPRAREPGIAGRRRSGSTPSASRWAGRCTAPTSATGTARARSRLRAIRAARARELDGHIDRASPASGCSSWWPTASRSRSPTASGWRCSTAAGARWPAASSRRRVARFDAAAGRRGRPRDRRLLLRGRAGGARARSPDVRRRGRRAACSTCAR